MNTILGKLPEQLFDGRMTSRKHTFIVNGYFSITLTY